MPQMTAKFSIEAGMLSRGDIKRQINRVCFENDVKCDIKEIRGWLESDLHITLKGEEGIVKRVVKGIEDWMKEPYE